MVQDAQDGLVCVICQGLICAVDDFEERLLRNQLQRQNLKIIAQILSQHLDGHTGTFGAHGPKVVDLEQGLRE